MDQNMKLCIGCDLAGYDFKIELLAKLRAKGYNITDMGCDSSLAGDYPIYAEKVAKAVVSGEYDRGIVICGTGQGVVMAANKVRGARAALCYDVLPAIMAREHNNANIVGTGAWLVTADKAVQIVEAFVFGKYSGGRHEVRVKMMDDLWDDKPIG